MGKKKKPEPDDPDERSREITDRRYAWLKWLDDLEKAMEKNPDLWASWIRT